MQSNFSASRNRRETFSAFTLLHAAHTRAPFAYMHFISVFLLVLSIVSRVSIQSDDDYSRRFRAAEK